MSQSNINASKLSLMPLPLPPIDEQREAVRRASQLLDLTDQLEQQVRQAGANIPYAAGGGPAARSDGRDVERNFAGARLFVMPGPYEATATAAATIASLGAGLP